MIVGAWPEGMRGDWKETSHPQAILKEWNPTVKQMGVVRDFIRMEPRIKLGRLEFDIWPWVLNIADALLVFGVGLLMLNFWRERKHGEQDTPPAADAQTHVAA